MKCQQCFRAQRGSIQLLVLNAYVWDECLARKEGPSSLQGAFLYEIKSKALGQSSDGVSTDSSQMWFRGGIFWEVLVFHCPGLWSQGPVHTWIFSIPRRSCWPRTCTSRCDECSLLVTLSFLVHLLLFAPKSLCIFLLSQVFSDSSSRFPSFPLVPSNDHLPPSQGLDECPPCMFHSLWWRMRGT